MRLLTARGRRVLAPMLAALALSACGDGGSAEAVSPEEAITGFDDSVERVDGSFAAIHGNLQGRSGELREAALAHLADDSPRVHYAALYALSLTAQPGESLEALRPYLRSESVDERFLAAGSLIARGDREAIPVAIELLDSREPLAYREPPQEAWDVARVMLLQFTEEDFGLVGATQFRDVAAAKPAWEEWWAEEGEGVRWDPDAGRFVNS